MFMHNRHITGVLLAALVALVLSARPVRATPRVGTTTVDSFRHALTAGAKGMEQNPLFLLLIAAPQPPDPNSQEGPPSNTSGYDITSSTVVFAPAAQGTPSQTGWHDHRTPMGLVLVVQGALWVQEKSNPTCLKYYPKGSVMMEHRGEPHNAFNLDLQVPAVIRNTFFCNHDETVQRTDSPDPVTGDPNVASPPPTQL